MDDARGRQSVNRRVATKLAIACAFVGAVAATALIALATRSSSADVSGRGAGFMVAACSLVAVLAVILIKSPRVLAVAAILAGIGANASIWSVLHDTHSTAALGVIAPPVIAVLGFGIARALETGSRPPPGAGWRA